MQLVPTIETPIHHGSVLKSSGQILLEEQNQDHPFKFHSNLQKAVLAKRLEQTQFYPAETNGIGTHIRAHTPPTSHQTCVTTEDTKGMLPTKNETLKSLLGRKHPDSGP